MTRKLITSLSLLAATLLAGCNSSQYDKDAYDFDPQRSRTRAILDAQYAKGAAEDATLGERHFDGLALNGLGRDKLNWMLDYYQPGSPLRVQVDLPGVDAAEAAPRLNAVRDYLAVRGVELTEQNVVLGPSPRSEQSSDAVAGMRRISQRKDLPADAGGATSEVMANQDQGPLSGD